VVAGGRKGPCLRMEPGGPWSLPRQVTTFASALVVADHFRAGVTVSRSTGYAT
jgi:hypothetical protein